MGSEFECLVLEPPMYIEKILSVHLKILTECAEAAIVTDP